MSIERTVKLLFLCLFFTGSLFYDVPQNALAAPLFQELTPGNGAAPPPLPPMCGGGGTPIGDYDRLVCCVSGYVYLDGAPTDLAEITVTTQNGAAGTIEFEYEGDKDKTPFFNIPLHDKPFLVLPNDIVTLTATYAGHTITEAFAARNTRGIQVDLVIPTSNSTAWTYAHLSARHDYAMAYDQQRQQVVLFGGNINDNNVQGDTWLWDGQVWTQQIVGQTLPPARWGHTMVYHEARQQVLMFGGEDENKRYLNDLWAWDGHMWLALDSGDTLPAKRRDHALVYDQERKQLLLFGGRNANGLNDTWLWHAEDVNQSGRWEEVSPTTKPAARYQHAMSYDPTLKMALLYGGLSLADDNAFGDTWAWDGTQWIAQQTADQPPALSGHTMAYDPAAGVLLFGGQNSAGRGEDSLWVWNGSADGQRWILRETKPDSNAGSQDATMPVGRADFGMVYDSKHEQMLLFGGTVLDPGNKYDLADTWALTEQAQTWQQVSAPPPFGDWDEVAMSYEKDGTFFAFGGNISPTLQDKTFRWQPSGWTELNPTNRPPARKAHRLARIGSSGNVLSSCAGSDILLFGGIAQNGTYLNDTWRWKGTDWQRQTPLNLPPPRAYHTLSYDCQQGEWVLFGGLSPEGEALNDLWAYTANDWVERTSPTSPEPRYQATLSYDPFKSQMYLFGGEDGTTTFNDLWLWNGNGWEALQPNQPDDPARPLPRAGHGAAYNPGENFLVIAGGVDRSDRRLQDTWSWNGQTWQAQNATPSLPPAYITSLDYDPITTQLVGLLNQSGGSSSGQGIALYQVADGKPQATISFINPKDVSLSQMITVEGRGRDADSTPDVVAHRWMNGETVLSTEPAFTIIASSALTLGLQTLTYTVQDNEGHWSSPVEKDIFIRKDDGSTVATEATWTILIYAAADNDLGPWLGDDEFRKGMLYRMKQAGATQGVQVGILYDGPTNDDTVRYTLTDEGEWSGEELPEADMGDRNTLEAFIRWGYKTFESDYYALHIASHANGITGTGLDLHGGADRESLSILTPLELREGLILGTEEGTRKLDLLHFDGCSFGLLENTAIADGLARFVVASANTMIGTFDYDVYRTLATESQNPEAYGKKIMAQYADRVKKTERAYTIALFDMTHFEALVKAVGSVSSSLSEYVNSDINARQQELKALRLRTQSYDSGGLTDYEHDADDEYVDLGAWLDIISEEIPSATVANKAQSARSVLNNFIAEKYSESGTIQGQNGQLYEISLEDATGLGIYYPPRSGGILETAYDNYMGNRLFHITATWDWLDLIRGGIPPLGVEPDGTELMLETRLIKPIVDSEHLVNQEHLVYLPMVSR